MASITLGQSGGGSSFTPPATVGIDGFWAPLGIGPTLTTTMIDKTVGNNFLASTNNKVWVAQFSLLRSFTVGHMSVLVTQLLNPSTFDVGIFDNGGNLLCNLGGVSGATTGNKTTSITQLTLAAGSYYMGWTATSTGTLNTLSLAEANGGTVQSIGSPMLININGVRHGFAANAATAGVLPSTLGVLTATNATDVYPPVMFCEP